jgi:hypothetical protein
VEVNADEQPDGSRRAFPQDGARHAGRKGNLMPLTGDQAPDVIPLVSWQTSSMQTARSCRIGQGRTPGPRVRDGPDRGVGEAFSIELCRAAVLNWSPAAPARRTTEDIVRPEAFVMRIPDVRRLVAPASRPFALTWTIVVAAMAFTSTAAAASPIVTNGDFAHDLSGWFWFADLPPGIPYWDDGVAVIPDNPFFLPDPTDILAQEIELPAAAFMLDLDFRNLLESSDTFGASLGFPSSPTIRFFDLNRFGPSTVNGSIGPSTIGLGWLHFTGTFEGPIGQRGVLVFALHDTNGVDDPGEVRVDNVSITAVPEPATLALVGAGVGGLLSARRGRRARISRSGAPRGEVPRSC